MHYKETTRYIDFKIANIERENRRTDYGATYSAIKRITCFLKLPSQEYVFFDNGNYIPTGMLNSYIEIDGNYLFYSGVLTESFYDYFYHQDRDR